MISTNNNCDQPMIMTTEGLENEEHLQQTPQIGLQK